jgi:uncharacterized protein YegJ (DUF2314 family)
MLNRLRNPMMNRKSSDRFPWQNCQAAALTAAALFLAAGCNDGASEPGADAKSAPPADVAPGARWRTLGASVVLPADAPQQNPALAAAIEKARSTMDEARARWTNAQPDARRRWAVKWAAPLESGEVEYLWVQPAHWSQFRIEGVLLNEPVHPLLDGAQRGDSVSLPAEELVDWMHLPRAESGGAAEGGFTNDAVTGSRVADEPQ